MRKTRTKVLLAVLFFALVLPLFVFAQGNKEISTIKKVAFISPTNQFDYFVYIGAEVKRVAEKNGIKIDTFDASFDLSKMSNLMTQAILQGYDAIIVAPIDNKALNLLYRKLMKLNSYNKL